MIRLLRVETGENPADPGADEHAALASVEADVVPTVIVSRDDPLDSLAELFPDAHGLLLVRAPLASEAPFFCPVLLADAADALVLEVAAMAAEACFGMSASRFSSALPRTPTSGAIESVLAGLSAASDGGPLPLPGFERAAYVVRRGFQKTRAKEVFVQLLPAGCRYGALVSRDTKSGLRPALARAEASLRGLLATPPATAVLGDLAELPSDERARLDALATTLETVSRRPVRFSFVIAAEKTKLVSFQPLRRTGLVALELARDLVARKVLAPAQGLSLIEPSDVEQAVELSLEITDGALIATGVAAGAGTAEGLVALTPRDAEAYAELGFPAILVVHEVVPEDIAGLRASAGIITVRGGITGEAAVMARGLAKPCVASGAGLSFAGGEIRVTNGGVVKAGERISIDGATGDIVRGAAARRPGSALRAIGGADSDAASSAKLPAAVSALLAFAPSGEANVIACVDHPSHVITAKRLGASGVFVQNPEVLAFETLAVEAHHSFERVVFERVRAIAAAAKANGLAIAFALPRRALNLPPPVGRPLLASELAALVAAIESAGELVDDLEIVVGAETTRVTSAWPRIGALSETLDGDLAFCPQSPTSVVATSVERLSCGPPLARRVLVLMRPSSVEVDRLLRAQSSLGWPGVAVACDLRSVLAARLMFGRPSA